MSKFAVQTPVLFRGRWEFARSPFKNSSILFLFALALAASARLAFSASAPTRLWTARVAAPLVDARDEARTVVRDSKGDLIVAGVSEPSGLVTIKYSGADGSAIWTNRYDNPERRDVAAGPIVLDAADNVFVSGSVTRGGGGTVIYTALYDGADGTVRWRVLHGSADKTNNTPVSLAVDASNNLFVCGLSSSSAGVDIFMAKEAGATGELLWDRPITASPGIGGYGRAMALDATGNPVVTGQINDGFYTAKLSNGDGGVVWEQLYRGPDKVHDEGVSLAVDSAGDVVATGVSYNNSSYDIYTIKYDGAAGRILWAARYNGPENKDDRPAAVMIDADGDAVITGVSSTNIFTTKYAIGTGAPLWERKISGQDLLSNGASSITASGDGGLFVLAVLNSRSYFGKYASNDGSILWQNTNVLGELGGYAEAVVRANNGDAVLTGYTNQGVGPLRTSDYWTARFDGRSGNLLWKSGYNGFRTGLDRVAAEAFDSAGNVVLLLASESDFLTAKFDAVTGTNVWSVRFNGRENLLDEAKSMALDGLDNVIVAGTTQITTNGYHPAARYVAKYAAKTGALLWERQGLRSGDKADNVSMITTDISGDIFLIGDADDILFGKDIYVAKYAGADGRLLWERYIGGPFFDSGDQIVLDTDGNPIIRGATGVTPYTAKLTSADGTALWETSSMGIGTMVVDGSGNMLTLGSSGRSGYLGKFSGVDRTLLWGRMVPPQRTNDYAVFTGAAVDRQGAVSAIGAQIHYQRAAPSPIETPFLQQYTSEGTLVWERTYNGPSTNGTSASGFALDRDGNILTMAVWNSDAPFPQPSYASRLIKFSGGDGSVLWELNSDVSTGIMGSFARADDKIAVVGSNGADLLVSLYKDNLPPRLSASVVGGALKLSLGGPASGWRIDTQVGVAGISGKWNAGDPVGSGDSVTVPLDRSKRAVFFRLSHP